MDKADRKSAASAERLALLARLDEEGADDLADPMRDCEEPVPLVCTCCGAGRIAYHHCKRRYCPSCARLVSAERFARWSGILAGLNWPLFITLTIPNSEDPESLRFLKKRWAAFRRRKLIREKVAGGLATFEITNKGNGWHPHLHAMLDCRWLSLYVEEPRPTDSPAVVAQKCELAQLELSEAWATQIDSPAGIVWVTRAAGPKAIMEVLKYAVKGSDLLNSPDPIAPMLRVLSATRTLAGFGSLFPLPNPDQDEPPETLCEQCGEAKSYLPQAVVSYISRCHNPAGSGRSVQPAYQR